MHCKKCQTLFRNTCAACPQCLSPVLSVDAKFIVKLLAASLCNPASILFALMAISPLDITITRETNVFSLPLDFFPLYLLVALFFFLLIFAAVYAMNSNACLPNFARTYVSVHLKYLFFYVWFPLMLIGGGMEGNVIGFLLLPIYALSQLISLPLFFWAMSRHLPTPPPEGFIPMYRVTKGARLALASLVMLVVFGIFHSGQGYLWLSPITGDQSRIPAVSALQNAMEAVKDRDPEKFERHVNLRGILHELRTQNKSDFDVEAIREKILAQIADGSAMPKGNEECDFLFELYGMAFGYADLNDNTRFYDDSYLVHPLRELGAIKKNDLSLVKIPVLYTKYGFANHVNFEVSRHNGDYRIERILNLHFSFYWRDKIIKIQRLAHLHQSARRLPYLRIEPTEAVELEPYDEKQTKVKFVFQIKNESTLAFPHLTVVALLRERQSGQMIKQIYYSTILDNEKIALTANETRTFAVKSDQLEKYQVANLLSGRYEIVLLITEATTADNKKITLDERFTYH